MAAKAYSYIRFSSGEQAHGDSPRRQAQLAKDYAARHGLELDTELTFKDSGVSAYRGRNAADGRLGDFLELVRAGVVKQGSYLLVESLDRISRQTARKALRTLEDIVESGVTLVTLTDGKAYTARSLDEDQMSLMWALMVAIRAHEESAMKGRRLRAAWEGKRVKARTDGRTPLTATCPGWLTLDKPQGRYLVIPERAAVVRKVFEMALAGVGVDSIVREFNQEGVPVFGSSVRKPPQRWHASFIARLIVNPAVIGVFTPHHNDHSTGRKIRVPGQPIEDYFPRIIDQDVWESVQGVVQSEAPRRGRHARAPLVNLLGGLARCPVCDSSMLLVNKGVKTRRKYVCSKAKAGAGCKYKSVDYEGVENALLDQVYWLLSDTPPQSEEDARLEREWDQVQTAIDVTTEHLNELLEAVEQGLLRHGSPTLLERIQKNELALEDLKKQEQAIMAQAKALDRTLLDYKVERTKAIVEAQPLDREAFNAALRGLFKAVVVDYTRGELVFKWAAGGESEMMYRWPQE